MKYTENNFLFSASDVSTYLACHHATQLHRLYALEGKRIPQNNDPVLKVLIERGAEHEKAYVLHLQKSGLKCTDDQRKTFSQTVAAMQEGFDVIVQGCLEDAEWRGFPDILIRIPGKSIFGNWMYEVQDTKLSRNTRASAIIQLCFYTDLLSKIQHSESNIFSIVTPGKPFTIEDYKFNDFKAYYAFINQRFKDTMASSPLPTYPDPVEHCGICNWWKLCDDKRRADDHLSLVAGLRRIQIEELHHQNIATLESFATTETLERPKRGNHDLLIRKQLQARIQLDGRIKKALVHQHILPLEEKRGFHRLPHPSKGDLYLDIEGDAFFEGGSFEYLFGVAFNDGDGLKYQAYWATNRQEEKESFVKLMSFILDRLKQYPDLSIYHYAPYEPATFKRLAHNYAVFEPELDDLLRKNKFVDLYSVVREAIIASVEKYSLKDIEKFAHYTRMADLRDAGLARRQMESALQLGEYHTLPQTTIETVRIYNEDDCLATEALHRWLENERTKLINTGMNIPRRDFSSDPPDDKLLELEKRSKLLFESLTKNIPADPLSWNEEHRAKWLLANQLQYFRRENKTAWWEHFRLQKELVEELLEDRNAIAGLVFQKTISDKNLPVHRYSFPDQETSLQEDDVVYAVNSHSQTNPIGINLGKVVAIDCVHLTVDIKKTAKTIELHPAAIHSYDVISIEKLWRAILAIAVEIDENGLGRMGAYRSAKDLLMRRMPQLQNGTQGAFIQGNETPVAAAIRLALNLNQSILPIQGPPGTGKTYTGAQIIIELIKAKKKVGVTAVSHRVITTLCEAVRNEALGRGINIEFAHKVSDTMDLPDWIRQHKDEKKVKQSLATGAVVGGTAWLWAGDDMVDELDYLIIDEAGQMSLSQALAASRAAKNVILLGDPQQLEQPQRGAHPEGSGVAALTHLLEGQQVMPEGKGLFLNITRRINPAIAKFTSEIFYNGELESLEGLDLQRISGGTRFDGAGLFHVPVVHTGNQNYSDEEINTIAIIVHDLLTDGEWTDKTGVTKKITEQDILIVAPFNAQVELLKEALPKIDIGTVDKFQGREAPVVIYSMTSSTVEDAPRGMKFLFNPNRLNVATSRAKCICILVASPRLFEAECKNIEQMRWANALCRYRELSQEVVLLN